MEANKTVAYTTGQVSFSDKAVEFAQEMTGIKNPVEACEAFSVACFMFYLDPQKVVDMIPSADVFPKKS